jgi:hypothetical protein
MWRRGSLPLIYRKGIVGSAEIRVCPDCERVYLLCGRDFEAFRTQGELGEIVFDAFRQAIEASGYLFFDVDQVSRARCSCGHLLVSNARMRRIRRKLT